MSTKIYDGCKINVSSMHEFQLFLNDLRAKIMPEIKRIILRHSLYHVADLVDGKVTLDDKEPIWGNLLRYGYDTYEKEVLRRKNKDIEYRASISVFFLEDKVLAMPFIASPDIQRIFTGHKDVEEYGYWNNTDQPDGVSDEEWRQRDEDWGKALGGDYVLTPVEAGVSVIFDEPDYLLLGMPIDDDVMLQEELYKVNMRFLDKVKESYITRYIKRNGIETPGLSDYLEAVEEFRKVNGTKEYLDLCEVCKKDVVEITIDILKMKLSEFKGGL